MTYRRVQEGTSGMLSDWEMATEGELLGDLEGRLGVSGGPVLQRQGEHLYFKDKVSTCTSETR